MPRPWTAGRVHKPVWEVLARPQTAAVEKVPEEKIQQNLVRLYERPVELRKKKRDKEKEAAAEAAAKRSSLKVRKSDDLSKKDKVLVQRFYYDMLATRQKRKAALQDKHEKGVSWTRRRFAEMKITDAEIQGISHRLYTLSVEQKRNNIAAMDRKYYPAALPVTRTPKQITESTATLYNEAVKNRREKLAANHQRYIFTRRPCKKIAVADPEVQQYLRSLASPKQGTTPTRK